MADDDSIRTRIVHAWNAFTAKDKEVASTGYMTQGPSMSMSPTRTRVRYSNEKSIISSINTRISIDVAAVDIFHVRLDEDDRYEDKIRSGLHDCLTVEANVDQAGRAFRQDIAQTLLEEGVIAIVPIDTTLDPTNANGYTIQSMRVGKVVEWYDKFVKVSIFNEAKQARDELTLPKKMVAIVENPLYAVMNDSNSTLQRLIRKLNILDAIDEQSGSGKLDLIIQLPYVIRSDARRAEAEKRRNDIEQQLSGSKYGIAYADGTERITQLNRPVENNLLKQIEYLTNLLYSQLGLTPAVFDGTADEKVMLNYNNRTVEPILAAITEAMHRSFLTKTARTQRQAIRFFRDPFKLVPVNDIAEIADKFTRNEIMSSNEIRSAVGLKPSKDPKADKLQNANMPAPVEELAKEVEIEEVTDKTEVTDKEGELQNES